jgi:hypothetical protein
VRKQAIRSLIRGIGSVDYVQTLLIAEDDFDENTGDLEDGNHDVMSGEAREQSQDGFGLVSNKAQTNMVRLFLHGLNAHIAGPCL